MFLAKSKHSDDANLVDQGACVGDEAFSSGKNPLSLDIWWNFHPPLTPLLYLVSPQFGYKDYLGERAEGLGKPM